MPGYQAINTAATWLSQGSSTIVPPPITTTTVRSLTAATASISAMSSLRSRRSRRSPPNFLSLATWAATRTIAAANGRNRAIPPSNCVDAVSTPIIDSPSSCEDSPTTTTAASAPRAAAAAAVGSVPPT